MVLLWFFSGYASYYDFRNRDVWDFYKNKSDDTETTKQNKRHVCRKTYLAICLLGPLADEKYLFFLRWAVSSAQNAERKMKENEEPKNTCFGSKNDQ